jgi:hypothetical protein
MITEETIVFNKNIHNKEDYAVMAFVIDQEVVDVFAISKTFLDLYNSSNLIERLLTDEGYNIDVVKDGAVVAEILVSQKVGAILLSEPLMIELNAEKNNYSVIPGMKYVDGISWTY